LEYYKGVLDDHSSQGIQPKPEQNSSKPEPIIVPLPPNQPNTSDVHAISNNQEQTDVKNLEDRIKQAEKWMILLTGAIAFFALCQVVVAVLQWREMIDSGAQTDKIIAADERIAKAMENTIGQAQKSLDAAIEQNRLDQRAWVGDVRVSSFELKAGETPTLFIIVRNSGKTPALDFTDTITTSIVNRGQVPSIPQGQPQVPRIMDNLQPNAEMWLPVLPVPPLLNITEEQIRRFHNAESVIYILGKLSYKDVFRQNHITTFCMYIDRDLKTIQTCHDYKGEAN
jgi:hypothetical protein